MSDVNDKPLSATAKAMLAFDRLEFREQRLLFIGVPITILVVIFLLFVEPLLIKTERLQQSKQSIDSQYLLAKQSNQELMALAQQDPNKEINTQIDGLKRRLDQLNKDFEGELSQLVSPQAMPVLLEQLFYKAEDLALVSMTSLEPQQISLKQDKNPNAAESSQKQSASQEQLIFRHGIEISFEGSFFATRDFLSEAQNLGWKLYWQNLSYKVGEHPKAITHLTLFTLSTSEAFIGVN